MQTVNKELKAALIRVSNDIIYAQALAQDGATVTESGGGKAALVDTFGKMRDMAAYAFWLATGERIDK